MVLQSAILVGHPASGKTTFLDRLEMIVPSVHDKVLTDPASGSRILHIDKIKDARKDLDGITLKGDFLTIIDDCVIRREQDLIQLVNAGAAIVIATNMPIEDISPALKEVFQIIQF